jgi:xylose isomerase
VGALLDIGHSLPGGENPAEAVALLNSRKKTRLDYIHLNDNWRMWDDDMMFGSVHIIEGLEFLYWLERTGYDGWYTLDIFPYREDGVRAARESIGWVETMLELLEKIGYSRIEEVIRGGDATEASRMIRESILG